MLLLFAVAVNRRLINQRSKAFAIFVRFTLRPLYTSRVASDYSATASSRNANNSFSIVGAGEGWLTELSTPMLKELFALREDAVAE